MGVQDLQKFIEENFKDACKPVDLIKLARGLALSQAGKRKGPNRLCLVVDGESCLDRLYGGFYSDWACGGQWNRMNQFLCTLIDACAAAHMELLICFNGSFERSRLHEWFQDQQLMRKNAAQVLKHINHKATPPPKVWWIPPVTLRSSLRMALRQWGVPVYSSVEDHHQEVIAHCRNNCFHGIVADESDYVVFNPPRYFSSQNLKLTYKGALETVEFVLEDVAKTLELPLNRFAVTAALLGSHLLSEQDVEDFHFKICNVSEAEELKKINSVDIIKAVVEFVRLQESVDDLDALGKEVFGSEVHKISKFKQTVRYYLNGTEEHFMKHRKEVRMQAKTNQHGAKMNGTNGSFTKRDSPINKAPEEKVDWDGEKAKVLTGEAEGDTFKADDAYMQHESGYAAEVKEESPEIKAEAPDVQEEPSENTPSIVVNPPTTGDGDDADSGVDTAAVKLEELSTDEAASGDKESIDASQDKESEAKPEVKDDIASEEKEKVVASEEKENEAASEETPAEEGGEEKDPEKVKAEKEKKKAERKEKEREKKQREGPLKHMYKLSQDAIKIARERHSKGLMHPWVYQTLQQREIKIDCTLEDENSRELPTAADLFRPIRQSVYSILFDYNKRMLIHRNNLKEMKVETGKEKEETSTNTGTTPEKPTVTVREWSVPRGANAPHCDEVSAVELEWLVPGLHKLWLGQMIEDKNRRFRAFMSSLHSDVPLMLNTSFVPQHLIVLCAVLRYIVKFRDQRVLRRHELDAFLCTAVSPLLRDVETMQEMKLPALTARGVQLGSLFMRGVEHAIFVNDACGAPVPWGRTCPWNFFDGKLFHFKLLKANNNAHLIEICDGQMDQVMRVERMRQAILQDVPLDLVFAKPPLPPMQQQPGYAPGMGGGAPNIRPAGAPAPHQGNQRGGGQRRARGNGVNGQDGHGPGQVDARGGQLQIAGVVISNWGPNMQNKNQGGRSGPGGRDAPPPQVTSVGPRRGRGVVSSPVARGRGMPGRPGSGMRGGMSSRGGQGPRPGYGSMYGGMQGNRGGGAAGGPSNYNYSPHHHAPGGNYGRGAGGNGPPRGPPPPHFGGHGMQNGGSMGRGGPHPRSGAPPASGTGRGGPTNKFGSGGSGSAGSGPGKQMTLEQRTKSPNSGRGRGCTVENQQDGNVVSVSQLIKEQNTRAQQHYMQQEANAAAAVLHQQQQQQQQAQLQQLQQQQQHSASQAQLAASQAQAHQVAAGHMMSQHQHMGNPTQVSMSQAGHLQQMGAHLNLAPSPQLSHAQQQQQTQQPMSVAQQMSAVAAASGGQMGGGPMAGMPGLLTAAQMASVQSNMAAMTTAAELSAQMNQIGALNGQTDFGQYGGGVNLQATDLSALSGGPADLGGMMNHAEFSMHHMNASVGDNRHERIGMFDMNDAQN